MLKHIPMALSCVFLFLSASYAQDNLDVKSRSTIFSGPYDAEIIRIIDGDTVDVSVAIWPGLKADYAVRIKGIDAPELYRPDCEAEREWAEEARAQAERLYPVGQRVQLRDVSYDSFSGRVVADLRRWRSDRWLSFSNEMLERKMAVEWRPGQANVAWCLLAAGTEAE